MCSFPFDRFGDDAKHEGRRRELMALRSHLEAQTKSPIAGMPVELLLMVFDLACRPVAPLTRLSPMARSGAFTSYALALVTARGTAEESASQGAGVARTITREGY